MNRLTSPYMERPSGDSNDGSSHNSEPVILAPVDVDPRSWFSNERTCIEWLHSAGILSAFAAGLVASNDTTTRTAGIGMLIPAIAIVLHAARMQHIRARQLDTRTVDAHFDRVGPTLLTFLLSILLLYNVGGAISRHMYGERSYFQSIGLENVPATSLPPWYGLASSAIAVGGAVLVTLPARMACAPKEIGLARPFLDKEQRTASTGPLRPKLLYANERTFIHWSHLSTLIASAALSITSSSHALGTSGPVGALVAGTILTIAALALLAYAHRTYFWRANAIIHRGDQRCDDPLGPPLLALTLCVVIGGGLLTLCLPNNAEMGGD